MRSANPSVGDQYLATWFAGNPLTRCLATRSTSPPSRFGRSWEVTTSFAYITVAEVYEHAEGGEITTRETPVELAVVSVEAARHSIIVRGHELVVGQARDAGG
ncbi:MAG: hypothetical protein ACYDCS_14205 [Candidatus Dormibacteria bacterium]